jgi:exopolysaccharide biosynthesis polyprenyl glycosylphosphotransferase
MLRRERQVLIQVQRWVDAALFAIAFWLAYHLRAGDVVEQLIGRPDIGPFSRYAWMLLVVVPLVPLFLQMQGFYARPLLASRRQTFWQAFWGSFWVTLALVVVAFLTRADPARLLILFFGPIGFGLLMLKEELILRWLRSNLGQAQLQRRLIVVGTEEDRESLRERLPAHPHSSVEIIEELDLNNTPIETLLDRLHQVSPDGVLLAAKHTLFGQVEKVIAACELEGVEVWLVADFFKTQVSQTTLDDFLGTPMLVFRSTPNASWEMLAKQILDRTGAALLLLLASPIMLTAALAIRFTSPGTILFRQQRCGLNGRPFTMLKFRSMATDAEQRKHELEQLNEMSGPVFKVTNDPRVTPVGRWLRRYSIDEFPQLLNVLRGQMSLVGPRPLPLDEVARFDDLAHRRRLSVKPGITCLWQVSGRNNLQDFKEWVRLDLEYIDNWSLWLDLKILWRTVPVVLTGAGAR